MNLPDQKVTGTIFNIQRYSIHDGPGIRSVIFFKGCPLHCAWCENPESIKPEIQLGFYARQCINCGACEKACPKEAINISSRERIDWAKCNDCGECGKVCPSLALQIIGETLSVEEVVARVLRDKVFFNRSGGGTTISGGEPTLQYNFLYNLLSALKNEAVHTVLETNGVIPWMKLKSLIHLTDIFYFDLKAIDSELHRELTGVENGQILENVKKLVETGVRVVYRLPMIPSLNISSDSIKQMAQFLDGISAAEVHLLPYHSLGTGKLGGIHTTQHTLSIADMSLAEAEKLRPFFERPGRRVLVGGA